MLIVRCDNVWSLRFWSTSASLFQDSHWSHFQIQPGHPPRKNPFFDKEAQMEDKRPANSEPNGKDNIPSRINEKNAELNKLTDGKTKPDKWNPFNLSYPVKIESGSEGDDSLGCGQELAWRTFLKGSKRLSFERLQQVSQAILSVIGWKNIIAQEAVW